MKKFLLMSCVAMAALSASAQKLQTPKADLNLSGLNQITVQKVEAQPKKAPMAVNTLPELKHFTAATAPAKVAAADIAGTYIEVTTADELVKCDSLVVGTCNVQDEETGETYNVVLNFGYGYVQGVYGQYDSETQTITIPTQQCYHMSSTSFGELDCALYGVSGEELTDGITLTYSAEDNMFELNEDGYMVLITTEGNYQGYYVTRTLDGMQAIAQTHTYTFSSRASGTWTDYTTACAVVENDYSYDVYGAFNLSSLGLYGSAIQIDKNDDGTISLATKQNVFAMSDINSSADTETFGEYLYVWPCIESDGSASLDIDDTVTSYDGITQNGILYVEHYLPTISNYVEGTGAYGWWNYAALIEPIDPTGISGVVADKTNTTNDAIYNLAGQQVSKAYKGIVIVNGKKMIQK